MERMCKDLEPVAGVCIFGWSRKSCTLVFGWDLPGNLRTEAI